MPEGSTSAIMQPLPVRVSEQSLEHLFLSIDEYRGTRYRSGGATPEGFDCSGFVKYLYKQNFRMLLPRTSGEQALLGAMVPKKQLRPGDLVFFSIERNDRIDHVGIFIGNQNFAHAASNGVKVNQLYEHYYNDHYACAARLISIE